jgi:hypothetical protein
MYAHYIIIIFSYRHAVKRIVITSSITAILRFEAAPITVTEADWGNMFVEQVKQYGKDATAMAKYSASKVLAEKGTNLLHIRDFERLTYECGVY